MASTHGYKARTTRTREDYRNSIRAAVPPVRERGAMQSLQTIPGWGVFYDAMESVPELQWPESIYVYHRMRSDSQISSLYHAAIMPMMRYRWFIDPNGSRPDIYEPLAEDLGLPVLGNVDHRNKRPNSRFNWRDYMWHAFLCLIYGHMFFEQVGEIDEAGMWRLRKLAPRMPYTIGQIKVSPDGGLLSIVQNITNAGVQFSTNMIPEIKVDRLVAHVWNREGANWIGRSVFRDVYRNWLLKDRLLRIDAIRHERNGLGVPIIELPPNATKRQQDAAERVAQSYRAGLASGGSIPNGMKFTLKGVEGATSDVLASIKYHDEAMSRKFLAMFIQLGITKSGSRALSESFIDFFDLAQENYADNFVSVTNEHVIGDWVEWNFGPDEELHPRLVYEKNDEPVLSAMDLATMLADGVLRMDDELEDYIRDKYRLPPFSGPQRFLMPSGPAPVPGTDNTTAVPGGQPGGTGTPGGPSPTVKTRQRQDPTTQRQRPAPPSLPRGT